MIMNNKNLMQVALKVLNKFKIYNMTVRLVPSTEFLDTYLTLPAPCIGALDVRVEGI